MSNQHTENHNENFTLYGALKNNDTAEAIIAHKRSEFVHSAGIIPWMQYHRANVPHLARHSHQR